LIIRNVLACFLLFLISESAIAQNFDKDYSPLTSTGTLPEEFLKTARSISEEEVKTLDYKVIDRLAKQQFIISSNYFLRDLLLSGDVLINDRLTKYVNKVADELLKKQLDLTPTTSYICHEISIRKCLCF